MDVKECQSCGCEDIKEEFQFGYSRSYVCNHCGHRTIGGGVTELERAEYQKTRCPLCNQQNNKTIRGPQRDANGKAIRHHWCYVCKMKFASVQETEKESA